MTGLKTIFIQLFHSKTAPIVNLAFLALALRIYNIQTPLWLDEIIAYRLRDLGLLATLNNSLLTEHPPLYYFIIWVGASIGSTNSEIAWRWLSVVWGVLAIPVIWLISSEIADKISRIVITLFMATSPVLIFYSQEARSYAFEFLLAAISIWIVLKLFDEPLSSRYWLTWALISLLGMYSGYGYAMVAGTQCLCLGIVHFKRFIWWKSTIIIIAGLIPLLPFAYSGLHKEAVRQLASAPLTFWRVFQTLLVSEQAWYGTSLAHITVPLIGFGLVGISFLRAIRMREVHLIYLSVQLLIPLVMFFALIPLFGIHLTIKNARIFIVLLPAFFLLMAAGLSEINSWSSKFGNLAAFPALTVGFVLLIFNFNGLKTYYSIPKSPSSLAVLSLKEKIQLGERAVSLHQRLNFGFDFYTSGIKVYLNPLPGLKNESVIRYQLIESKEIFEQIATAKHNQSVDDIRRNKRFWILFGNDTPPDLIQQIVSGCRILEEESYVAPHERFTNQLIDCP